MKLLRQFASLSLSPIGEHTRQPHTLATAFFLGFSAILEGEVYIVQVGEGQFSQTQSRQEKNFKIIILKIRLLTSQKWNGFQPLTQNYARCDCNTCCNAGLCNFT